MARLYSGQSPILGINVALQAPSFTGSGVYSTPPACLMTGSFLAFHRLPIARRVNLAYMAPDSHPALLPPLRFRCRPLLAGRRPGDDQRACCAAQLRKLHPNQCRRSVFTEVGGSNPGDLEWQIVEYRHGADGPDQPWGILPTIPRTAPDTQPRSTPTSAWCRPPVPPSQGETIQVYVNGLGAVSPW